MSATTEASASTKAGLPARRRCPRPLLAAAALAVAVARWAGVVVSVGLLLVALMTDLSDENNGSKLIEL
jgi:hypothetical protein